MAAMLENNAKNKNATNIFINQLHNIKPNDADNGAPEYAEVDGLVNEKQTIVMTDINQGPYATTTLSYPINPHHTVRYIKINLIHINVRRYYVKILTYILATLLAKLL